MSSPEPRRQQVTAARSVLKAKQNPTNANLAEAVGDMRDEYTDAVAEIKADLKVLKTDVGKLLHHFGLTSGSPP